MVQPILDNTEELDVKSFRSELTILLRKMEQIEEKRILEEYEDED
jgi:hypothetical protein